jgi:hypothetical protein
MIAHALTLTLALAGSSGGKLEFDRVFDAAKAPSRIYYEARYHDGAGNEHRLKVWRDRGRIRRDTDDRISVVAKIAKAGEVSVSLFDHDHKARVEVSRSRLYQLGVFTDWSELTSSLARPRSAHAVSKVDKPGERRGAERCAWFAIVPTNGPARRVCWSAALHLPMAIEEANGVGDFVRTFEIEKVRAGAVDSKAFAIDAEGYAAVRADRDDDAD